jgi:alkylation response protein AidB-like acyl-CoA dehydrogenase
MIDAPDTDAQLVGLAHALAQLDHPVKTATSAWAAQWLSQHDRVEADRNSTFAFDDWRACADRGIFGSMVPEAVGGAGDTLATTLLTLEGLGHGCRDNGLTYAVASQMLSTQVALAEHGTPAQQEQWLTPMLAGTTFGAFGMTETGSGSDAYAMSSTATERPDGSYVLNGHKAYITFGSICDVAVVFAATDPDAGAWGVSAFVVPADADGFERVGNRDKMGMRTTPFGDIVLHDVVVPATALLGRPGSGASIFNQVLQVERAFVFATQVGAMQRHLERAIAYAQERVQGGGPIAGHQAVAHRIADMKRQHETARLFLYRAAIAKVSGTDFTMCAALAKLVGSETGINAAVAGADIHGAKGYVSEFEVERDLRDAIGGLVYSGTSDIQRNIIARLLGAGS